MSADDAGDADLASPATAHRQHRHKRRSQWSAKKVAKKVDRSQERVWKQRPRGGGRVRLGTVLPDEGSGSADSGADDAPFGPAFTDDESASAIAAAAAETAFGVSFSPNEPRVPIPCADSMRDADTDADGEMSDGDGTFAPSSARRTGVRPPQRRPLRRHENYRTMFMSRLANMVPRPRSECSVGECTNHGATWCDTCQLAMCNA